jgi:hypothetical protein
MRKIHIIFSLFSYFISLNILAADAIQSAVPEQFDDVVYGDFLKAVQKNDAPETVLPDTKKTLNNTKTNNTRKVSSEEAELSNDFSAGKSFSVIRDPDVLSILEKRGYDFYSQFSAGKNNAIQLGEFATKDSNYNILVDTLNNDLQELVDQENQIQKTPKVGVGMAFSRRLFDIQWLTSHYATFELIGVVSRIDRVAFDNETCGETRLIYRLAYTSKIKNYSRLPFTIMIKYQNSGNAKENWQACKNYVKSWVYPVSMANNGDLVDWITTQGPLNPVLRQKSLSSIELNLQALRIPSAARPDLAGHGTYLLRVFKLDDQQKLKPSFLENTPDVKKITGDKKLKAEFFSQFSDRHFINRLEAGVLKLDEKYLATRAWSYSPYGIGRKENRPFDSIITENDLKTVKFDSQSYVRSAAAGIMRLNDLSCIGCHQARAHAGFHFLGIDKKSTHPMNSLFFEGSGHFETELRRRSEYMQRILNNLVPNPNRDFSFSPGESYGALNRANPRKAGAGHYCGMGITSPFAHWQCVEGLTCQNLDEAPSMKFIGKCIPKISMTGDPTVAGYITQADHNSDKLVATSSNYLSCGKAEPKSQFSMGENKGGFPSGHCSRRGCKGIIKGSPTEVCGESAGNGFNECIYETKFGKISFTDCLVKTMSFAGRGRCSSERSCRNDYVCARSTKNEGYCTPSYFLFQVRLDGHINPKTGL